MDGIDIALLRTDGTQHIEFGPTAAAPYNANFVQQLNGSLETAKAITMREHRPGELAKVEREITTRHSDAIQGFLRENNLNSSDIDLIGFHGQTVLHRPAEALTVQIGDGQTLADNTGISVVWDMRANDMRNGGQGAPLVPVFHQALAQQIGANETVAFVNIGGIANVTFVQPGQLPIAFDCGPGNALIDQWMQRHTNHSFDEDGALALQGSADQGVIDGYLRDSFFEENYPKSLDRNDFSLSIMADFSPAEGAATLAALTARATAKAQETAAVAPKRWIISGGGARNAAIMQELRNQVPNAAVDTADDAGLNSDMMEAQCWAYLAVRAERGLPLTFPTTTGCEEPCTGGVISHPTR